MSLTTSMTAKQTADTGITMSARLARLNTIRGEIESVLPDHIHMHAAKLKLMCEIKLDELSGVVSHAVVIPAIKNELLGINTKDLDCASKHILLSEDCDLDVDHAGFLVMYDNVLDDVYFDTGCSYEDSSLFVSLKTGKIYGLHIEKDEEAYALLGELASGNLQPLDADDEIWKKVRLDEEQEIYNDFVKLCDYIYDNVDRVSGEINTLIEIRDENAAARNMALCESAH